MRAVAAPRWGGPEVLELVTIPRPQPGPTEILIRVHAAGVNPADCKSRAWGGFGQWGTPPILGYDVSGVVQEVGIGASLFAPGDEVFGMPRFPEQAGGYAEYVTGPSRHFAAKPPAISHIQAAALPLSGLTAWQALIEVAHLQPGQRVLIHAGAGGVGHLAVQIAKARGAHVIATASAAKHELLRALGVDDPIDYNVTDFSTTLHDLDVVLDTVGGEYGMRSLATLRPGGLLISLAAPLDLDLKKRAKECEVTARFLLVEPDRVGLLGISELVESRKLQVHIAHVMPLEDAGKAHLQSEIGRTAGKLVLTVLDHVR